MLKSVKVHIGGQEYNLRTDDEEKVRQVAEHVDLQMQRLRHKTQDPSTTTLSVLTALNIAEDTYNCRQQQKADTDYITAELEEMAGFLNTCMEGHAK